jgi:hypothetical protein
LRKAGYVIENKTSRIKGQAHGWFRLVSEPGKDRSPRTVVAGDASHA